MSAESQLQNRRGRRRKRKHSNKKPEKSLSQLMSQLLSCSRELPEKLIGIPNECDMTLKGITTAGLIDTCSSQLDHTVSNSVSETDISTVKTSYSRSDLLKLNNPVSIKRSVRKKLYRLNIWQSHIVQSSEKPEEELAKNRKCLGEPRIETVIRNFEWHC